MIDFESEAIDLCKRIFEGDYPIEMYAAAEIIMRLITVEGVRHLIAQRDAGTCVMDLLELQWRSTDHKEIIHEALMMLGFLMSPAEESEPERLKNMLDPFTCFLCAHR